LLTIVTIFGRIALLSIAVSTAFSIHPLLGLAVFAIVVGMPGSSSPHQMTPQEKAEGQRLIDKAKRDGQGY
jgi:hypothetical protein